MKNSILILLLFIGCSTSKNINDNLPDTGLIHYEFGEWVNSKFIHDSIYKGYISDSEIINNQMEYLILNDSTIFYLKNK